MTDITSPALHKNLDCLAAKLNQIFVAELRGPAKTAVCRKCDEIKTVARFRKHPILLELLGIAGEEPKRLCFECAHEIGQQPEIREAWRSKT